jgi:glutamyl/glutaminyl-tRNA synthetase
MVFEVLGKKSPWTGFLGRYHFKDMELSTTKFRQGIESGKYSGWDDPKLPTLASLKKQGYKPEALWKMAEHIGLSEVDKVIEKIINCKFYFEIDFPLKARNIISKILIYEPEKRISLDEIISLKNI